MHNLDKDIEACIPRRSIKGVPDGSWKRLRMYCLENSKTVGQVLIALIARLKLKGEK